MIFNVSSLMRVTTGKVNRYKIENGSLEAEDMFLEHINGKVTLMKTDCTILATCDASAEVNVECARCLTQMVTRLSVHLEEEFTPTNDITGQRHRASVSVEDPALIIDEKNMLDLSEVLRQQFRISMPISPLCDLNCRGLCTVCGYNRNLGEFGCKCRKLPLYNKSAVATAMEQPPYATVNKCSGT